MGLSRERKIFVGLLGVAGLALVVDRGVLQPGEVSAKEVSLTDTIATLAASAGTPGTGKTDEGAVLLPAMLAERLNLTGMDGGATTNAFALPASWVPTPRGPGPENRGSAPLTLKLSAVMPSRTGGIAIINGATVRVGEEVEHSGYRLARVTEGTAVLEHGDRTLELSLPQSEHMGPDGTR